jgi:hypothetical protein
MPDRPGEPVTRHEADPGADELDGSHQRESRESRPEKAEAERRLIVAH